MPAARSPGNPRPASARCGSNGSLHGAGRERRRRRTSGLLLRPLSRRELAASRSWPGWSRWLEPLGAAPIRARTRVAVDAGVAARAADRGGGGGVPDPRRRDGDPAGGRESARRASADAGAVPVPARLPRGSSANSARVHRRRIPNRRLQHLPPARRISRRGSMPTCPSLPIRRCRPVCSVMWAVMRSPASRCRAWTPARSVGSATRPVPRRGRRRWWTGGQWRGRRVPPPASGWRTLDPHDLFFRGNCLACHSGPSAVAEIRTAHPERADCRQCHVAVRIPTVDEFIRPIPAMRGTGEGS